jgi:hypothetical protein
METEYGLLPDVVHRLYQGVFLLSKWNTVLRYTSESDFIYSSKKRTAFPEPIFTKLKITLQYYVQICYTVFHPNRTIKCENYD